MDYFEKNRDRFNCAVERNGMKVAVCHYPARYYIARELQVDSTVNSDTLAERYRESLFFVVAVTDSRRQSGSTLLEREGAAGFSDNVIRNTFQRQDDIFMTNDNDTVAVANCTYERNWGMGNEDVFLVTFVRSEVVKRKNLRLRIRELANELGTIDIPVKRLMRKSPKVRGIEL